MKRTGSFATVAFVALFFLVPFVLNGAEACGTPAVIAIDIKPGSDTNPLNVNSRGVVPVAIFGSEVDVTTIDVASVLLENEVGDQVTWSRWSYQDIDEDGNLDLLIKFRTTTVVSGLGLDQEEDGATVDLTLSGVFSGPNGDPFSGQDSILIVNKRR